MKIETTTKTLNRLYRDALDREAQLQEANRRKAEADRLAEIRERCRTLRGFVREAWAVLEPDTPLVWGWAMDAMCEHLEAVTRGEITRLLINVPPGMMKSMLTSVFWPAWEWGPAGRSGLRILGTSYAQTIAVRDCEKMRMLIQSDWYQAAWGDTVKRGRVWTSADFHNTRKGWRKGVPFTRLTGERGDRLIIDDPLSRDQADSMLERLRAERSFRETVPTRQNNEDSAIVVIMQRLNERDTTGLILQLGLPYDRLILPMEFDGDNRSKTVLGFVDPRKKKGQLLFPERFSAKKVAEDKAQLGAYGTAGQFQQSPIAREGALFQREWFGFVEAVPANAWRCRAWDLAATESTGGSDPDYTAGVRVARDQAGYLYIEHAVRRRSTPSLVERLLLTTAQSDPVNTVIRIPQDPGQAGKDQAGRLVRLLAGFTVYAKSATGSKYTRATPAAAQAGAHNVRIVRTGDPVRDAWIEPFLDELCVFPNGAHDDQVDAFSDAVNSLVNPEIKGLGFFEHMGRLSDQVDAEREGRAPTIPSPPVPVYGKDPPPRPPRPGSLEWLNRRRPKPP